MFISIFTDELKLDVAEAIPIIRSWGLKHVDFRSMVFGKRIEELDTQELAELKKWVDDNGMTVGCLQTSLCKDHLPDAASRQQDVTAVENLVRAADILECRLVRSFHYWKNYADPACKDGDLAKGGDKLEMVLEMLTPVTDRARAEGLVMAFENCDVHPDDVFAVLDALSVPGWGLAWDVNNNWYCDERREDEDAYINKLAERALCVHVKAGGALNWLKRELIPYKKVFRVCHALGLTGPVSAETHNPKKEYPSDIVSRQVIEVIRLAWPKGVPHG